MELPHNHQKETTTVASFLPTNDVCIDLADTFKLLSDASRLRIVWLLLHVEECVSNISAIVNMSDQAVSHHLKVLKKAGFITSSRKGKEIFYKASENEKMQLIHQVIEELMQLQCPLQK